MEILVGLVFLLVILILLNTHLQERFKLHFQQYPDQIFLAPFILAMFVCAVGAQYSAINPDFRNVIRVIFAYTFVPTFLSFYNRGSLAGTEPNRRHLSWVEFLMITMLWLPIEFSMMDGWLKRYFQQTTHIIAYGTAITLGLFLFLLFRGIRGMKYNLPRGRNDFVLPFFGLLVAAATLIPLGLWLKFIRPFNVPADLSSFKVIKMFGGILLGVALPEEILFRGLLQNWLMQKFGDSNKTILTAALIFGAAHLNNGPGALPNWRYMILATIAGFIYGKVFQGSNSIFASTGLHAAVNTIRHTFFA